MPGVRHRGARHIQCIMLNSFPLPSWAQSQVYVDGEFIGGCDIVVEMYQKGELQELAARVAAE